MDIGLLDQLGTKYGTDKASRGHDYLSLYERFLSAFRHTASSILEVGVYNGGSLPVWRDYFPNAHIIGLDIDSDALRFSGDRVTVEMGDQSSIVDLTRIAVKYGPFDLILDDGSHIWDHQLTTLRTMLPHVKLGGYYILEDIDTSYGSRVELYQGIAEEPTAKYLQRLSDYMIGDAVIDISRERDAFIRSYARRCEFITFGRRTSIIKMRA